VYLCRVKIFGSNRFRVYVHELDHPPAHCHVRFGDKSEVCVTLPFVEPMYGATISREVREAIVENLDALIDKWETLHRKDQKAAKKKKVK